MSWYSVSTFHHFDGCDLIFPMLAHIPMIGPVNHVPTAILCFVLLVSSPNGVRVWLRCTCFIRKNGPQPTFNQHPKSWAYHPYSCIKLSISSYWLIYVYYYYIILYIYTHCRFIIPYTCSLFIHPDHLRHDSHKYTSTVKVNPIPSTKYVNICNIYICINNDKIHLSHLY